MPKSRSDYIRDELEKDFDAPAQTIADRLGNRGIKIEPQQVYNVRSIMREEQASLKKRQQELVEAAQKTRAENRQSLSQHILEILKDKPDGLTDVQLEIAVKKAGYITRSTDFIVVLRQKLYDLSKIGKIIKNNGQFRLGVVGVAAVAVVTDSSEVAEAVKVVAADAVQQLEQLVAAHVNGAANSVPATASPDNLTDYHLLRDAVTDFAKSYGLSPTLADDLIAARRDVVYAQENYARLLAPGDNKDGSK